MAHIEFTTHINTMADFKAWSGAKHTLEVIKEHHKISDLDAFIMEWIATTENHISETAINDLLWHDFAYVFEALDIDYN
tara:strand:+ start:364 stop:600 length:237 start_codon:yes stop_codon:yes gene_type:complete